MRAKSTASNHSHSTVPVPPMSPALWGTPEEAKELSPDIQGLLREVLGVSAETGATFNEDAIQASTSRLDENDLGALRDIVGEGNLDTADEQRLRRARGKSTPDLLAWRTRPEVPCPDAVLAPRSEEEISAILTWCGENSVAVVPFGGGTSVVGGVNPDAGSHRAVISLDLAHFDELYSLDPISGEAELGAGLLGPRAEELLAEQGFELGHYPQSFPYASIGGFAMTRSSGQDSSGYGRFDEMVRGLTVVTPVGIIEAGRAPASAAGPDLKQWLLGSEGAFGVCTRVRVRVHPLPATKRYEAFRFPDFATGSAAVRAVAQHRSGPTVIRLSDETETMVNLATTHAIGTENSSGGCLCITVCEGDEADVEIRAARTRELLLEAGGTSLGEETAQAWAEGRFGAPVLRDALLDNGALCETLETATNWSNVVALRDAVAAEITEAFDKPSEGIDSSPALVMCHISHIYPTGASLYFTVVAGQRGDDPIAQWMPVKRRACEAILANNGTITHHHAVGVDHRDFLATEIGEVGVKMLRAVKAELDPHGICNPGTLIP